MGANKLTLENDRDLLAFIFARFIDGEFTGLREGVALNYAPDLEAADFLARQIRDEIRHAQMYKALFEYVNPGRTVPTAPWLLNLIMAPITGRLWAEHCFLDKAVGERWVLNLMEALIERTDDRKISNHLKAIAKDERAHIDFGETQTRKAAAKGAFTRFYLWGLFLRVDFALALAYWLTRSLIARRYSAAAAEILTDFFTTTRTKVLTEAAALVGVKPERSYLQMFIAQLVFLVRLPFVGWFRNPRKAF